MKRIITTLAALATILTADAQLARRLDSLAEFYNQTFDFNGSVLVSQKGKILFNKGYGYKDKERNLPNTPNSIYLIGSITKQFTAEVILMLAREGKLSLADKLSKYFPDYRPGDSITLEQMLIHTSGIPDYTREKNWEEMTLTEPVSNKQLLDLFTAKPLIFKPGADWEYSNSNYLLLGMIISQVTGKSYYSNVQERIFRPLGMSHTGFDLTHLKDTNKTTPYYLVRRDTSSLSFIVDSTQTNSAGSIYSTTGDMLKWHNALLHYTLLNKKWQDKAFAPYKKGYGYGWENDSLCGHHILSHSGHIFGYNANWYHLRDEDVCIVVLTNAMKTGADPIAYAADIVKAMYDQSYAIPAARKEVKLSTAIEERYAGKYIFTEDSSLVFEVTLKNNRFYLQLTGQPMVRLLAQSETLFFTKLVDAQIEFRKNEDRYDLILHQNGADLVAKKQ